MLLNLTWVCVDKDNHVVMNYDQTGLALPALFKWRLYPEVLVQFLKFWVIRRVWESIPVNRFSNLRNSGLHYSLKMSYLWFHGLVITKFGLWLNLLSLLKLLLLFHKIQYGCMIFVSCGKSCRFSCCVKVIFNFVNVLFIAFCFLHFELGKLR